MEGLLSPRGRYIRSFWRILRSSFGSRATSILRPCTKVSTIGLTRMKNKWSLFQIPTWRMMAKVELIFGQTPLPLPWQSSGKDIWPQARLLVGWTQEGNQTANTSKKLVSPSSDTRFPHHDLPGRLGLSICRSSEHTRGEQGKTEGYCGNNDAYILL